MEHEITKYSIIADYYSLHYEEVKAFVAVRLQFAEDTEDIVQNVFVRLLQMDKMITPITLPCLVYTVAKNLIFDYWRHKNKVDEYEHYITKLDWASNVMTSSESVYSSWEVTEVLECGIAKLGEKQRKIYRMNLYDGMPVSEISLQLGLNYKCVENRLGSARKMVRSYMKRMLA